MNTNTHTKPAKTRLLILMLLVVQISCSTPNPTEKKLFEAAEALDDLAKLNEEYGTASLSYPKLSVPKKTSSFDVNIPTKEYVDKALTISQGGVSHALMVANVLTGSMSIKNNSPMIAGQFAQAEDYNSKHAEYCSALFEKWRQANTENAVDADTQFATYKTECQPVEPNPPEANTLPAADGQKRATNAENVLKDTALITAVGGLLPSALSPSISYREAVNIAAGDKATEIIYRLLGDSNESKQFKDKVVLIAASMVSVNPGWRTRSGFAAKVEAQLKLEYKEARNNVINQFITMLSGLSDSKDPINLCETNLPKEYKCDDKDSNCQSGLNPLVAAVSPLTETQTLDLSNSERKVTEFSLALAGVLREASLAGQAEVFEQYVRSNQRDSKTRSVNSVTNSYSINGGQFGYQIGPKFKSLDIQGEEDESANILEPQSFPVLLLIGLDQTDLNPRVKKNSDNNKPCEIVEPKLVMNQSFSWLKLEYPWYSVVNDGVYPSDYIQATLQINKTNAEFAKQKSSTYCKNIEDAGRTDIYCNAKELLDFKTVIQQYPIASRSIQDFPMDVLFPKQLEGNENE